MRARPGASDSDRSGFAQTAPASAQGDVANPLQPVDTSSPRATFNSFRIELEKAYRAWRQREHLREVRALGDRVLRTLDLDRIGEAFREDVGLTDALYLYDTLAKLGMPPLESIPDAQAVAAQGLTEWTFPGTEITIVKVAEGEQAGRFLFSAETVRRAGRYFDLVQGLPSPPGYIDAVGTRRASPGLLMPEALAGTSGTCRRSHSRLSSMSRSGSGSQVSFP